MQIQLHYVEYPDIDIQINYPNNMVNADAPLENINSSTNPKHSCLPEIMIVTYLTKIQQITQSELEIR